MILWVVDAAIVFTVLEAAGLWAYGAARRRPQWRAEALNVAAGLLLMSALRAALAGAGWPCIAVCLACAGAAHAVDLRTRLTALGR